MNKLRTWLFGLLGSILLTTQVMAGTWTANEFLYKPDLGARGVAEKSHYDTGLDRIDARLGKTIWVGDPKYGATLQTTITAIDTTACILRVPGGTHNITDDLTIPANITLRVERGATLAIATAKTLTINGTLEAGAYQIFSCTGTGKVLFGAGASKAVLADWWDNTDYTAVTKAIAAASNGGLGVEFTPGRSYTIEPFTVDNTTCPQFMHGNGVTLTAKTGSTGPLVTINMPYYKITQFVFKDFILDASHICTIPLYVKGGRLMVVDNIKCINGTSHGAEFIGGLGYGLYYNKFSNIISGVNGAGNAGDGFYIHSDIDNYYNTANVFINLTSQFNAGNGIHINYSQNDFINPSVERNDGYGVYIDHSNHTSFHGGYGENNHQDKAGGGAGDGSPDIAFRLTANSIGVRVLGGRYNGYFKGDGASDATSADDGTMHYTTFLMPSFKTWGLGVDNMGKVTVGGKLQLPSNGSFTFGNITPTANGISFTPSADAWLSMGSSPWIKFIQASSRVSLLKPITINGYPNIIITAGAGSPEGVVTASPGSLYLNASGGANTTLYVKESGGGNTGWVGK
jgi:hypothetical protein